MSGTDTTRTAPRNVPALLLQLRESAYTGTVTVSGTPGGSIHLRDGLVCAVVTPGAPTTESALLKSGRVDDNGWTAARAAVREDDGLGAELVERGLVGAVELEVTCTAAVFDGAFAMALSPPGGWEISGPVPAVVVRPGIEPRRLAEETNRRMAELTRLWGPPGQLARTRIRRPAIAAGPPPRHLHSRHRDVLLTVNGRRTPRDIAFALGRGLYGVMLDLIRLDALRLLQWEALTAAGRTGTAPRAPEPRRAGPPPGTAPLPRRNPGGHIPDRRGTL